VFQVFHVPPRLLIGAFEHAKIGLSTGILYVRFAEIHATFSLMTLNQNGQPGRADCEMSILRKAVNAAGAENAPNFFRRARGLGNRRPRGCGTGSPCGAGIVLRRKLLLQRHIEREISKFTCAPALRPAMPRL
jgi:hypothetical protein